MKRLVLSLLVTCALAAFLGACGAQEGIGEAASTALSPHVQAVRVAATRGDRDAGLAHLSALRQEVARLRSEGDLSRSGAATVLEAALDVERQLMLLPAPARQGADDGTTTATTGRDAGVDENKAEADARKRAEEAAKKAEEEAKKLAEEAKKRAGGKKG